MIKTITFYLHRHVTIVDPHEISSKVDILAQSLNDTNHNLEGISEKLSDYRDLHNDSMDALTIVSV